MSKNNMGRQVLFAFGQSRQNIQRSPFMSLLVLGTMMTSLFILGFLLLTLNDIQFASEQLNQQLKIVAFLKQDTSLENVSLKIEEIQGVVSPVSKVSKEDAQKMMFGSPTDKNDLTHLKDLFKEDNPFPDSIVIEVNDLNQLSAIGEKVKKLEDVEEVQYNQTLAEQLEQIKSAVNLFGFSVAGILLIASLANIINTIQLAVYHRRKEIEVMTLVGAPHWFIRLPFIIEGFVLGTLSGVLSSGLLLLWRIFPFMQLKKVFPFMPINPTYQPLVIILLILIVTGLIMGTLGSFTAVRRHLKTKKT